MSKICCTFAPAVENTYSEAYSHNFESYTLCRGEYASPLSITNTTAIFLVWTAESFFYSPCLNQQTQLSYFCTQFALFSRSLYVVQTTLLRELSGYEDAEELAIGTLYQASDVRERSFAFAVAQTRPLT